MPNITELYSLYLRQLETTLAESELLLQREGGLDGELKTSGYLCEQFIRSTLEKFIVPGQFSVTSGYVATPEILRERRNLPQCDILIVDKNVPPLLKLAESKVEVVPYESVVGIIEAKRTLTKKSLADALDHLEIVVKSIGRDDSLKMDLNLTGFNRAVGFDNHSSSKPLLGIVAMKSDLTDFYQVVTEMIGQKDSLVDFVWTLDGKAVFPSVRFGLTSLYYTHTARPANKTWTKISVADFASAASPFYKQFSGDETTWSYIHEAPGFPREAVFSQLIGLLSLTMSRIFARPLQEEEIQGYYLNTPF